MSRRAFDIACLRQAIRRLLMHENQRHLLEPCRRVCQRVTQCCGCFIVVLAAGRQQLLRPCGANRQMCGRTGMGRWFGSGICRGRAGSGQYSRRGRARRPYVQTRNHQRTTPQFSSCSITPRNPSNPFHETEAWWVISRTDSNSSVGMSHSGWNTPEMRESQCGRTRGLTRELPVQRYGRARFEFPIHPVFFGLGMGTSTFSHVELAEALIVLGSQWSR